MMEEKYANHVFDEDEGCAQPWFVYKADHQKFKSD